MRSTAFLVWARRLADGTVAPRPQREHGGKVQGSQVPRHHVEVVEHYDIVGYGCC